MNNQDFPRDRLESSKKNGIGAIVATSLFGASALCFILAFCGLDGVSDIVHIYMFILYSFMLGFIVSALFMVLWSIFGPDRPPAPIKAIISAFCFLGVMAAGDVDVGMAIVNELSGHQPVYYQTTQILRKTFGTSHNPPHFAVDIHLSDEAPASTVISYVAVGDRQLFRNCSPGDVVRIGLRRGGLGFTYVASIEKVTN